MTDREKLIALFDHFGIKDWKEQEYTVDHLASRGVTVRRWIPVTERVPKKGSYLVCKSGYGGTRYLDVLSFVEDLYRLDEYDFRHYAGQKKAGFVYYDSEYGYCEVDSVTHWMPLPDPPKEGE